MKMMRCTMFVAAGIFCAVVLSAEANEATAGNVMLNSPLDRDIVARVFAVSAREFRMCNRTFTSVSQAYEELKRDDAVASTFKSGLYHAFEDQTRGTFWTFTRREHEAHPAMVCRDLLQENGAWVVHMKIHCEAEKNQCDALARDFNRLNQDMEDAIRGSRTN